MASSAKPVLYSYFRSSASFRVRIALEYKGIDYEYKPVHLVKGHQQTDEYKDVNPMGQVPALQIDGAILTQSVPIIEYLEEKYPDKRLLPTDLIKRAQSRQLAEIINSGIAPLQNLAVIVNVAKLTGDDANKAIWARNYIEKGFGAFEKILEKTAGKYCVGDDVSIADLCLVPQIYNAKRFEVDLTQYPIISRIHKDLETLDAFKKANPLNQPDCPEELKAK